MTKTRTKAKAKPLTPIQIRAMAILRDHGPLLASAVGQKVWPDRQFKNSQGQGFAGGCLMGKLAKIGLVTTEYRRPNFQGRVYPAGWVLASKGRAALSKACTALVNSKHEEAMNLADLQLFEKACTLEREAAEICPPVEPSRSVLCRSAGNLAMEAELYDVALRMARRGLKGDPPAEIKVELQELEKTAWKARVKADSAANHDPLLPHYVHPKCEKCKPERLGYMAFHTKAEERMAEGIKQTYCRRCKKYRWPQEIK